MSYENLAKHCLKLASIPMRSKQLGVVLQQEYYAEVVKSRKRDYLHQIQKIPHGKIISENVG